MTDEVYEGAIGIDLGTTYSRVAVWQNGRPEVIATSRGSRRIPSCVAFTGAHCVVGDAAKDQAALNPTNTVFDIQRLLGRTFEESVVQMGMRHWPFKIVKLGDDGDDKPLVEVLCNGETLRFAPEELTAMIIATLKNIAEIHLGKVVKKAVITVPAFYNDSQRQATIDAGAIAGLQVLRLVSEPMAAAIAHHVAQTWNKEERNVLVVDFGGGKLDVAVIAIDDDLFEVKAVSGNAQLGGVDFEFRLMSHFIAECPQGMNVGSSPDAIRCLRDGAEHVKSVLSSTDEATFESVVSGIGFHSTIGRHQFEDLCGDLFRSVLVPLERVLADARIDKDQVHAVLLFGGSSRIPKVRQFVSDFFKGKELTPVGVDGEESVACGAAMIAFILCGGKDPRTDNILSLDVTPFTLGIETAGGVMVPLFRRGTTIPAKKTHTFTTYTDFQSSLCIPVYEGERAMTKDNRVLGKFDLEGIQPEPRGVPQIEVTFDIDANGILRVVASARDWRAGKMTVRSDRKSRVTASDLERMAQELTQRLELPSTLCRQ